MKCPNKKLFCLLRKWRRTILKHRTSASSISLLVDIVPIYLLANTIAPYSMSIVRIPSICNKGYGGTAWFQVFNGECTQTFYHGAAILTFFRSIQWNQTTGWRRNSLVPFFTMNISIHYCYWLLGTWSISSPMITIYCI